MPKIEKPDFEFVGDEQELVDRQHGLEKSAFKYRKAYESGKRAASRGFAAISPFYGDEGQDWWFSSGYDGLGMDEAWNRFREQSEA